MIRILSIVAALTVGATVAHAESAAIDQRQQAMKTFSDAAKGPGAVLKGEAKFDLDEVHSSLATYQEQAAKLKALWPDDSKTGETNALPDIWEDRSAFLARFDKLAEDAKAAAASIKDEATFKAEWPKVLSNCISCHEKYRKALQ